MWSPRRKRVELAELLAARAADRAAGRVVVWTNGTFDLLHPGHLSSLEAARALGDVLVVGLNSDASVRGYKGPTRPILTQDERAAMLAAVECVDRVYVFDDPTPAETLARLQPDVHCKGAEYAPPHGRPVPEADVVRAYGGRIEYLPLVAGLSTTDLIRRVCDSCPPLPLGERGGKPRRPAPPVRAVLLLDRDGTLMDDVGYPRDPAAVRLVPGAADAVRRLVARGYAAIIVSNQSGLARGLITPAELDAVQERFADLFEASSGVLLPWLYCPHGPADGCDCRKPLPGLLNQAASAVNPRLPRVMVGDKPADVAAGIAAGARTAWLAHGRPYPPGEPVPNLIADDWGTIADWAERLLGGSDG